ncbi:MAG: hypothetical protein AAFY03_12815 [Pseudomonadota bacterium]
MAVMDDIADELAIKALALEEASGDENAIRKIADALATSSPTMEETFLTAVRIRRGEARARKVLDALVAQHSASAAATEAQAAAENAPKAIEKAAPAVSFDED